MARVPKNLKRSVIREELVAITGHYIDALVLNQFMYWSERIRDFDQFLIEENRRRYQHGMDVVTLQKGWIYKTAEQLISELMIKTTPRKIRQHIENLIAKKFIFKRNNPKFKWDRTFQYRVDFNAVVNACASAGYQLEGFKKLLSPERAISPFQEIENAPAIPEIITETKRTPKKRGNKYHVRAAHGLTAKQIESTADMAAIMVQNAEL